LDVPESQTRPTYRTLELEPSVPFSVSSERFFDMPCLIRPLMTVRLDVPPYRLSIKAGSERYFGQQTRRISRVFGHAWFHHREVFEECEVRD
jgi:hypothetical protein